jgi:O-antigen/teichoic acid export membrane protein
MRAGAIVVGGNLLGAGAAFGAAVVAARVLSIDEFAAFGVGLAVNSLAVQFGDLGLGTVAIAETAGAVDAAESRGKLRTLVLHRLRTALMVAVGISVVVLILPPLSPYRDTAVIGATGEVFGSIALFLIWSLQGQRRFRSAGALQAVQGGLRLALVGGCAIAGLGAIEMIVGYAAIAPAATALVAGPLLFSRLRGEGGTAQNSPAPAAIDVERRRVMAVAGVFSAMVINGDVLLLAMLSGEHDVGVYSAAWRFSSGVLLINTAVASALLPFIVTAADAWWEVRLLVRRGLMVAAGWFALVPLMAVVGPWLLGSIGEEARTPLLILLIAFAIDGFYFVVYQIYLRVRRERLLAVIAIAELAVMAGVTLLLRDEGASAPAYGQLAARIVACLLVACPVLLALAGRCRWFEQAPGEPPGSDPPAVG